MKIYETLPKPITNEGKPDVETIRSEFLIDNIDRAFEAWHESPLLKDLSFEDFKEFILPYRTNEEWVPYNRSSLKKIFHNQITKGGMHNITKPIEWYKTYIEKCRWINYYISSKEHTGLFDLFLPAFKMDCENISTWTCNYFRSIGIPVVYEYSPQWPDKNRRHFWCVSPDSNQILQPFSPPDNNLGEDWKESLKFIGKVYRKTYGVYHNSPYFIKEENEYVPEELDVPTIKDETFRYHQTVILRMRFNETTNNNLAYLCFFNTNGINPVASFV